MSNISLNYLYSSNKYWNTSGNNIITTNSGNLGIGISNPLFKLDIGGSLNVSSNLKVGSTIGYVNILDTPTNSNNFNHSINTSNNNKSKKY